MPLTPVAAKYLLANGETISEKELQNRVNNGHLEHGIFPSYVPGAGNSMGIAFPQIKEENFERYRKEIASILTIINTQDFGAPKKEELRNLFNKSTFCKFYLIDILLPYGFYVSKHDFYSKLQGTPDEKRKLFNALIEYGAKYEHLITDSRVGTRELNEFIKSFGISTLNKLIVNVMPLVYTFFMGRSDERIALQKLESAIRKGIDPNLRHPENGTFLHIIIADGMPELAIKIIAKLKELRSPKLCQFDYTLRDAKGRTPLLLAVKLRQNAVIKELIALSKQGVNVEINLPDNEGRTPLMVAAALGNSEVVKLLLESDADLNAVDQLGRGLDFYMEATEDVVSSLLRSANVEPSRDVRAKRNWLDSSSQDARALASDKSKHPEKLVLLSTKPEDWQLINDVYREAVETRQESAPYILQQLTLLKRKAPTVLQVCVEGQIEARKVILAYRETLFREACAVGDVKVVKEFIEQGINIEATDELNRTPLHYAVMREELIQAILKKTNSSKTATECLNNRVEIFELLLKAGANSFAKNKNGNTPIDIIRREAANSDKPNQNQQIMKTLTGILNENHEGVLLGLAGFFSSKEEQRKWDEVSSSKIESDSLQEKSGPGYGF